jgi:urease accessory protein
MLVADTHLGNRDDPAVAERLADADPHRVVLSATDRRRSRVRTETVAGRDVGVVVGRPLDDGDVLETDDGALVVVELAAVEALVLAFGDDVSPTAALELGHAVGNRHRDLAVRGREALVPVADSRERTEALVADHLPDGATIRYEAVPPTTFDDGPAHAHDDGGSHTHESTHGEGASHTHGEGSSPDPDGSNDDAARDDPTPRTNGHRPDPSTDGDE